MSLPDFTVSVQASPAYPVVTDLVDLPLPDHFPEPYCDPYPECHPDDAFSETSTPLPSSSSYNHVVHIETGDTTVYGGSSARQVLPPKSSGELQEVREGIRRITDKYAAPGALVRNSSAGFSPTADMPSHHAAPRPPAAATSMNSLHSTATDTSGMGLGARLTAGSVSAFSDVSSDLSSDASPVPPWTGSTSDTSGSTNGVGGVTLTRGGPGSSSRLVSVGGVSLASLGDGVTDQDVQQVEMFYRSHKSEVTVCRCLANLYFGTGVPRGSFVGGDGGTASAPSSGSDSWEFINTGIPLLVLDSGQHVRERRLSVVLAEKGTGFVLWKDVITHLTHYACPHANFHTLRVSADNNKLAGLSFDDSKAANDFAATIRQLTSDPDDDLLMLSKKGKKKKKKPQESKRHKYKPPKKTDISQPCCFQHVTKLERPQVDGGFVMPPPPNGFLQAAPTGSLSSLSDHFHDKVTLSLPRARSQSSELSEVSSATSEH